MNRNTSLHLTRLAVCVLGGVISCVALFELLLMLDVVSAYDIQPDLLAGAVGVGIGLLRFGGPNDKGTSE